MPSLVELILGMYMYQLVVFGFQIVIFLLTGLILNFNTNGQSGRNQLVGTIPTVFATLNNLKMLWLRKYYQALMSIVSLVYFEVTTIDI